MNTTKTVKAVKNAETAQAITTDETKAKLAILNDALPALREQVADIADGVTAEAEVKTRLKRGEDIPEGALTFAKERDEIAPYLLKVKEGQALALTKTLPADSTLLADKVAPAFMAAIPGVSVIVTTAPFKSFRSDIPLDTPPVVVLCVDPLIERDGFRETLEGTVSAYFVRPSMLKHLSVEKIEGAHRASKPDCSIEVTRNIVGDVNGWVTLAGTSEGNMTNPEDLIVDILKVKVSGVVDGLPVLPKVGNGGGVVKTWVLATLGGFLKPGTVNTGGIHDVSTEGTNEAMHITYGMGSTVRATHPKVSEEIDGTERTLTVKHVLNLSNIDPVGFADDMNEGSEGWINSIHLDAGVLVERTVTPRVEGPVTGAKHVVEVVTVYKSLTA